MTLVGKLKPSAVDYLETWAALESFVNEGLVRAIGLSNFSLRQLKRVLENCRIKPAVLQIECNAFWVDKGFIHSGVYASGLWYSGEEQC